jgi:PhzF family phenazine biosynthesis protein
MRLKLFHIDAFTNVLFAGNPAAVVPLDEWLPDDLMQQIAFENNLAETAFFVKRGDVYELRWFTVAREVDLCGHATLATAFVLFDELQFPGDEIRFTTRSGELIVKRSGKSLLMDFPAIDSSPAAPEDARSLPGDLRPVEVLTSKQNLMVVLNSESEVARFDPDASGMRIEGSHGVMLTARGEEVDFVSRCFYPEFRVEEDPVTGSAHCQLAPYWSKVLNKSTLRARQLSKRGGEMLCEVRGQRVFLTGSALTYLEGNFRLPSILNARNTLP